MSEHLYATFPNALMAERAIGALLDHGATPECISLVIGEADGPLQDGRAGADEFDPVEAARLGITTTTGADAAVGAAKGAGIGLGVGAVAALACLIIPGFGLVIGGGALTIALGATAATTAAGAIAGGLTGYLIDQGVSDRAALAYQDELSSGRCLLALAVPCGDLDRDTVVHLLDKYLASSIGGYLPEQPPVPVAEPVREEV